MTRVAQKSFKHASYVVAAIAGAVLVMLGIQVNSDKGKVTNEELPNAFGDTVHAGHPTGGDFGGGDDDGGDGGGGGGGGGGGADDGPA